MMSFLMSYFRIFYKVLSLVTLSAISPALATNDSKITILWLRSNISFIIRGRLIVSDRYGL